MIDKIKSFCRFIWNWITVIVTSCLGALVFASQLADFIGGFDLSPLIGPEKALAISTSVAITKAVLVAVINWAKAKEPA